MTNLLLTECWVEHHAVKTKDEHLPGMKHIRVYGYSPDNVAIQVRALSPTGAVQHLSSARPNLAQAIQIRDALTAWIDEHSD